MRLLLVEDDATLGDAVRDYLVESGHVVDWSTRLAAAREAVSEPFDVILLDWRLPDGSGIEWLRAVRMREGPNQHVPVLVLTARDQLDDRVEGLDAGADDYLTKPFELAELAARVRAISRRAVGQSHAVLRAGPIEVDVTARTVRVDGNPDSAARTHRLAGNVAAAALRFRWRRREQHDQGPRIESQAKTRSRRDRDGARNGIQDSVLTTG
jgi:two-component system, OmpR family, response regulator